MASFTPHEAELPISAMKEAGWESELV